MRKFLRNMAKAKMKEMGYSKINKRMDRGRWREIVGAYPVNLFTGKKMSMNFRGRKKNKPGSYSSPLRVLMGSPFQAAKDEIVWVRGCNSDGTLRYVITSNKTRDRYFLYGLERGKWEKIAKARSPIAFEGRVKLY